MAESEQIFECFVIYRPAVLFMLRRQVTKRSGEIVQDADTLMFTELDSAREWCAKRGLVNSGRFPEDDKSIVEVWI